MSESTETPPKEEIAELHHRESVQKTMLAYAEFYRFDDSVPAAIARGAAEAHEQKPADEHKMVLIVASDLGMSKGKICAQCGHAALGAYKFAVQRIPDAVKSWTRWGETKVCLKVPTQEDLRQLKARADAAGLVSYLVQDAGRTQIEAGSVTVLAIGPAPLAEINAITGHLPLL